MYKKNKKNNICEFKGEISESPSELIHMLHPQLACVYIFKVKLMNFDPFQIRVALRSI